MSSLTTFQDTRHQTPAHRTKTRRRVTIGQMIFLVIAVIPITWSILYYGLIASNRYLSESRFLVRSAKTQNVSGLSSILQTFGISNASDDSYAVQSYILSRDALHDLMKTLPMETFLNREGVDPISTCYKPWSSHDFETLYQCYLDRVDATREETTGISVLAVQLYRPEDSKLVADRLLELGEQLANRMNKRAENDAVASAKAFLQQAEARVVEANQNLTAFRNQQNFLDVKGQATPAATVMTALASEIAKTRAEIDQQTRLSPSGPRIESLKTKVKVLEDQMKIEQSKLTGGKDALSNQISGYEDLMLRKTIADQTLEIASKAIDQARLDAKRQRIYIETIVKPNLADDSTRPKRLRMIVSVIVVSLMLFAVVWMVVVGGREHLNHNAE
ncbi:hypothetical protein LQ948_07325 [Jiella sp. MQZ9-1]|uniref:Capsular polysaccharide transport system permease protein n=1 Tax=Jiella flava TaxID=2816857 RepID=A0A939FWI6_9HYPH|nr:hypothetical protein [Jiella flava]MBO0662154.1 hypothetical protein [Jiella flava]MCD2471016.1 hypothetical protein [Jiella flava]